MDRTQLRALRAKAHALPPGITVGEAGLSDGLLAELDTMLRAQQLVKVRFSTKDRAERKAQRKALLAASGATEVLAIGKVSTVWREAPEPDEADESNES